MQPSVSATLVCPKCPACGAAARTPYYQHGEWEMFCCGACGLIYLDPMPGPQALAALYHNAYNDAQDGYFAKPKSKLRRSKIRVRIIKLKAGGKTGNFLDIGCNGGFMVEAARLCGYTAWGADPDKISVDYAAAHFPRNRYFNGWLEDFNPLDGSGAPLRFHVAYCSEVIEHVTRPADFLGKIFHLLAPGGLLYLTTPDISHWRRPHPLTRWDGFCPPSHCLYFSPESLLRLARRCGFELCERRPSWKPGIKLILRRPAP